MQLDNQFADIAEATLSIRNAVMDVRRSDGALRNGSVGPDQLSASLSIGFTMRGDWAEGVSYSSGDGVAYETSFYKALVAHTSTAPTRPDLDQTKWEFRRRG